MLLFNWRYKRLVKKLIKQGKAKNPWWNNTTKNQISSKELGKELQKIFDSCTREDGETS